MSNKDELLANFQAGSGIDDVGKAFTVLESCQWDLSRALNSVMNGASSFGLPMMVDEEYPPAIPMEIPTLSHPQSMPEIIDVEESPFVNIQNSVATCTRSEAESLQNPPVVVDVESFSPSPLPSTSHASAPVPSPITVNIQAAVESQNSVPCPLELPASVTVGELKITLYQIFGVATCQQILSGFTESVTDETVITTKILPPDHILVLDRVVQPAVTPITNGGPSSTISLLVHDETNNKDFHLEFEGSDLVKKVKAEFEDLAKIEVSNQVWSGWPLCTTDDKSLASLGIRKHLHLTVRNGSEVPIALKKNKKILDVEKFDDSSDENDESTDMFSDDFMDMEDMPSESRRKYLVTPHVSDEETGVDQFCNNFRARFGKSIPSFYNGSMEQALKDSVMLPAKSKRMLAVYLHHDGSIVSNVFCSQILCHQSVMELLEANYVIWGFDISHESNKARLLNLVATHFGSVGSSTIRSFSTEKYPALLLLNRTRGIVEILSVIHGSLALDEVVTGLLHAIELFEDQRRTEIITDTAREEREATRAEQNAAYEESLLIDRAKALAKKEAELAAEQEKERQQALKEHQAAIKLATKTRLEESLPAEPAENSTEPKTTMRFRTPNKEFFRRSFLLENKLEVVLNYLFVQGYPADEFKCIQSWPRRDITSLDSTKTLAELNMPIQESLTIEER